MNPTLYEQIGFYQKYFLIYNSEKIEGVESYNDLFTYLDRCQKVLDTYKKNGNSDFDYINGFESCYNSLQNINKRQYKIDSKETKELINDALNYLYKFGNELT